MFLLCAVCVVCVTVSGARFAFPGILAIDSSICASGGVVGIWRHDDRGGMPVVHASPCGDPTTRSATTCDSHRLDGTSVDPVPHLFPPLTQSRTALARHGDADTMFCNPLCARGHVCTCVDTPCVDTLDRSTASFAHVSRRVHDEEHAEALRLGRGRVPHVPADDCS